MISSVGKLASMGLVGGTIAGASIVKPKTKKGEENLNKFQTVTSLGALTATPFLVKEAIKTNPIATAKVEYHVGNGITKAAEYVNKAIKGETGSKVVSFVSKLFNKVKTSTVGSKVVDAVSKVVKKVASNNTVQKVATKVAEGLKKFSSATKIGKGKYALIAAGVSLLAYAGYKVITNFYKKEGSIEQKYDDLHKKYERMLKIDPITDARTGEPISFDEYCKLAQTMLK